MTCNMGTKDRTIRTVLAVFFVVLISAGAVKGALAVLLGIFAVVFLVTSFVRFCPLYVALKIDTSKKD